MVRAMVITMDHLDGLLIFNIYNTVYVLDKDQISYLKGYNSERSWADALQLSEYLQQAGPWEDQHQDRAQYQAGLTQGVKLVNPSEISNIKEKDRYQAKYAYIKLIF